MYFQFDVPVRLITDRREMTTTLCRLADDYSQLIFCGSYQGDCFFVFLAHVQVNYREDRYDEGRRKLDCCDVTIELILIRPTTTTGANLRKLRMHDRAIHIRALIYELVI